MGGEREREKGGDLIAMFGARFAVIDIAHEIEMNGIRSGRAFFALSVYLFSISL